MPKSGSKNPTVDRMDARFGKMASERFDLADEMQYDPTGKGMLGRMGEAARSTNARIRNTGKVNKLDAKLDKIDRNRANEQARAGTSRFMRGEDTYLPVDTKYMPDDFYDRKSGKEYRDVTSSVKKFSGGGAVKEGYALGGDVRYNSKRGKCY